MSNMQNNNFRNCWYFHGKCGHRHCNRMVCSRAATAHLRSCSALQSPTRGRGRNTPSARTSASNITDFFSRITTLSTDQTSGASGIHHPAPNNSLASRGGSSSHLGVLNSNTSTPSPSNDQDITQPTATRRNGRSSRWDPRLSQICTISPPNSSQPHSSTAPSLRTPVSHPTPPTSASTRAPVNRTAGARRRDRRQPQIRLPGEQQGITRDTWASMADVDEAPILQQNIIALNKCPSNYRNLWRQAVAEFNQAGQSSDP